MLSHVFVGSNDPEKSKVFYDSVMAVLGIPPTTLNDGRGVYITKGGAFGFTKPIDGEPATYANGGTIGFNAMSPEIVDAWHAAGLANGGQACEDPPGMREGRHGKHYLAYLRDPSGNKICAVYHVA